MISQKLAKRRFTDAAIRIVNVAADHAIDRGLHVVDQDSYATLLFWSLIRWERKVGLIVLETIGVQLRELTDQVDVILTRLSAANRVNYNCRTDRAEFEKAGEPNTGCDYDAVGEPLFTQAEAAARELGVDYVGTEHLLLGIVRCADPVLMSLFCEHLITYETVEATIDELFQL